MESEAEVVPPAAVKSASFAIVVPRRTAASSDFLKFADDTSNGEEEEVEVEIEPAYYSDGTKIPVFTPVSSRCYYCCVWRLPVWAVVVVRGFCADRK
jgi:hypothetical protein